MEPTENRPARRRLTKREDLAAALRQDPFSTEITGHDALAALLAYRRETSSPKRNAVHKLLFLDGPPECQTPRQVADALGHRSDTTRLYVQGPDAFPSTEQDTDKE